MMCTYKITQMPAAIFRTLPNLFTNLNLELIVCLSVFFFLLNFFHYAHTISCIFSYVFINIREYAN